MLTILAASCLLQAGQIAILEFSGEWCAPCKQQAPITRRLENDGVKVWHIDFDKRRDVADAWKVKAMPTLIVVDGRKELARFVGVTDYQTLRGALPAAVAPAVTTPKQPKLPFASKPSVPSVPFSLSRSSAPPGFRSGVIGWWFNAVPNAGFGGVEIDSARWPQLIDGRSSQVQPIQPTAPQKPKTDPLSALAQAGGKVEDLALACHVRVRVDFGRSTNWGSGVVIERFKDGLHSTVLTNKHVVENGGSISIDDGTDFWAGAQCEELWPLRSRMSDDLAVIRVKRLASINAPLCELGYKPLSPLYVVGSPGGKAPRVRTVHLTNSYRDTKGGWHMDLCEQTISGDSGGGVYDSAGYLVGLVWGNEPGVGGIAVDLTNSTLISAHSRSSSRGFDGR